MSIKLFPFQFANQVLEKLREHPTFGHHFEEPTRIVHKDGLEEQPIPVMSLDSKDPRIEQAREEGELDTYTVSFGQRCIRYPTCGLSGMFSVINLQ